VTSYVDHLAAIEVGNQGFAFSSADALNERRRARASFQSERVGRHSVWLLALDGGRPVATDGRGSRRWARTWVAGPTIPTDRRRGAMSALVARAWEEAVHRGMPALVTLGGRWPRRSCS
jgi:hypothetical protein